MSELHKFLFDGLPVRGMIVRLTDAWTEILRRRASNTSTGAYPAPVSELLGEMAAAGVLMQSNIKFNGALVLQVFGDGPVKLTVAEVQSDLSLRATLRRDSNLRAVTLAEYEVWCVASPQYLQERGMPQDLLYLAMIESGFLPSARSRAGAVGLWRLMGGVAKDYGLRVDRYVDERRDPRTRAAVVCRACTAVSRCSSCSSRPFDMWSSVAACFAIDVSKRFSTSPSLETMMRQPDGFDAATTTTAKEY